MLFIYMKTNKKFEKKERIFIAIASKNSISVRTGRTNEVRKLEFLHGSLVSFPIPAKLISVLSTYLHTQFSIYCPFKLNI